MKIVQPQRNAYATLKSTTIIQSPIFRQFHAPVKSASKKLAPTNLAPLKFTWRNIDYNKEDMKLINTQ